MTGTKGAALDPIAKVRPLNAGRTGLARQGHAGGAAVTVPKYFA